MDDEERHRRLLEGTEYDTELGMARDAQRLTAGEITELEYYQRYHDAVLEEFGTDDRPIDLPDPDELDGSETGLVDRLPVHPEFGETAGPDSDGPLVRDEGSPLQPQLYDLVGEVADRVSYANMQTVADASTPSGEDEAVPGSRSIDA